jgi:signal transduction histidine kinase
MLNVFKQFGAKATGFPSDRFYRARLSLTIIYVALLAVILFFSSGITYSAFSQRLENRFERFSVRVNDQRLIIGEMPPPPTSEEVRGDLLFSLLFVDGFFLILAGVLSYWLAGLTLKPIKAAYDSQKQFLGDASHELRTPLAILQTDLENEMLVSQQEVDRQRITSNLEEVGRMSRLVENLLALSRFDEEARVQPKFVSLDLLSLIKDTVDRLETLAQQHEVTLGFEKTEKIEIKVFSDKEMLSQVLSNVIKNAILYNKPGGQVTIKIEVEPREVKIFVADTGIGIAKKDLTKIFDRFYRVDKSRSRQTGGSGLGLSIVRSIIEQLNGSIKIISLPEQGTTVTLSLPIVKSS